MQGRHQHAYIIAGDGMPLVETTLDEQRGTLLQVALVVFLGVWRQASLGDEVVDKGVDVCVQRITHGASFCAGLLHRTRTGCATAHAAKATPCASYARRASRRLWLRSRSARRRASTSPIWVTNKVPSELRKCCGSKLPMASRPCLPLNSSGTMAADLTRSGSSGNSCSSSAGRNTPQKALPLRNMLCSASC